MPTALLIVHGLVAVALLGAITHQVLATWAPVHNRLGSVFSRFRAVPAAHSPSCFLLYAVSAAWVGLVYGFRVDIRPSWSRLASGPRRPFGPQGAFRASAPRCSGDWVSGNAPI